MSAWDTLADDEFLNEDDQVHSEEEENDVEDYQLPHPPPADIEYNGTTGLDSEEDEQDEEGEEEDTPIAGDSDDEGPMNQVTYQEDDQDEGDDQEEFDEQE